jgi:hypothetical protein
MPSTESVSVIAAARSRAGMYCETYRVGCLTCRAGRGRSERAGNESRLRIAPDAPGAEGPLQRAVAHSCAEDGVERVAQRTVRPREHSDVVACSSGLRLDHEATAPAQRAVRDHVVQQHGIDAAGDQIGVGMHVIVVGNGYDAHPPLCIEQHLVGGGAAERGHTPPREILQPPKAIAIPRAHRQHFAKFEVRHGERVARAQLGRVFYSGETHIEVAALHRGGDRRPRHLHEAGVATETARHHRRDLDVEAAHARRIPGIGLDERRAAFRVAAPPQSGRCLLRQRQHRRRDDQGNRQGARRHPRAPRWKCVARMAAGVRMARHDSRRHRCRQRGICGQENA